MKMADKPNQPSQEELDHHANQNNPNNDAYQDAEDNRANQLNPNHKDTND